MKKGQAPGRPHQARKRFGQNFLKDAHVIDNIIKVINPQLTDNMIEIGPGLGALTEQLVDQVQQLAVVELDRDLIPHLNISFATRRNFRVFEGDALKYDFNTIKTELGAEKLRIVGNLPYNISTPLLFRLIEFKPIIQDMYFMLQKEVVERMAAGTGEPAYGRLSIMMQYHCSVEPQFLVPPSAFSPAPKVDSAIVRLTPHAAAPVATKDIKHLGKLVTTAFNQRRKTIRNALKTIASAEQLATVGIDPDLRPEQLSLAQYAKIADLTLTPTSGAS